MNEQDNDLVSRALAATSPKDGAALQDAIAASFGSRHERPLGDRWSNLGILGSGGSFDLTLIEQVTNMQDAVIENLVQEARVQGIETAYTSPASAAGSLLSNLGLLANDDLVKVQFVESDGKPSKTKRLTAVFRDRGIGMTPESIPESIFRLGGSNKEDAPYLQGAFGLGGALTYRNAEMAILVTRKNPALLEDDEDDRISVAVVEWVQGAKGRTAVYLVDQDWDRPGDEANVWSTAASNYPDFEYGTHIALLSYRVEGVYRERESDEKSFPSVVNTRLYRPVMPVLFTNETSRGRNTKLRGLEAKLDASSLDLPSGEESLIFRYEGETYVIPVAYTIFNPPGETGGRRSMVAHDHVVIFLSNGQVHHHWNGEEFKNKTRLNKLKNRIFVSVETDDLPISLRTQLFTPDRSALVRADIALRLEEAVRSFIDGWEALRDENNKLVREALQQASSDKTYDLGQQIGRAVQATGFASSSKSIGEKGGKGSGSGLSGGGGGTTKPVELLQDPTYIKGPDRARGERGRTMSRTFIVNAVDEFFGDRGNLEAEFDHDNVVQDRDISIGKAHNGRIRVQIAIPDEIENGLHPLKLKVENWFRKSGALGARLDFVCQVEIVDEIEGSGSGLGGKTTGNGGKDGASSGMNVALLWTDEETSIARNEPGLVEQVEAATLASSSTDYEGLASLGDTLIPTITLNSEYAPLKRYLQSRSKALETLDRPRARYALGVGVALVLLEQEMARLRSLGVTQPADETLTAARDAAARAVLAVMPSFDELARETGVDE